MNLPRVLITSGEPAGVGPDLVAQIAQRAWPVELVVIGDKDLLLSRAKQLNLPLTLLPFDKNTAPKPLPPGHLKLIAVELQAVCEAGKLNQKNARYVEKILAIAADAALNKTVDALVTAPVHKGILNEAGLSFLGHTEFFAAAANIEQVLMLFVVKSSFTSSWKNGDLKVALLTTHLPLAEVAQAITAKKLEQTIVLLRQALRTRFGLADPCIFIAGLNPHAGEGGYLGREEIDLINPVLNKLRAQNMKLKGPFSADTLFTEKYLKEADAILAMYHDQALPVVKTLGFGKAVNVTLGLPFIRTSVDHGTALDVAGTARADASSLNTAIELALSLLKQPSSND
ncbi:MAG TPA: 4-hydroxythreonine-4-phosphate dehydrogenase PdxA [Gammaproteobacteria bacterium]|nr:4-hydroxythreonine-4-phosphate dehydrogenase PdxA [Gammaproteobacteria bacterium]